MELVEKTLSGNFGLRHFKLDSGMKMSLKINFAGNWWKKTCSNSYIFWRQICRISYKILKISMPADLIALLLLLYSYEYVNEHVKKLNCEVKLKSKNIFSNF